MAGLKVVKESYTCSDLSMTLWNRCSWNVCFSLYTTWHNFYFNLITDPSVRVTYFFKEFWINSVSPTLDFILGIFAITVKITNKWCVMTRIMSGSRPSVAGVQSRPLVVHEWCPPVCDVTQSRRHCLACDAHRLELRCVLRPLWEQYFLYGYSVNYKNCTIVFYYM